MLVTGCSLSFEIDTTNNDSKLDEETSSFSLVVPDVSGMTVEDARSILKLNGFDVEKVLLVVNVDYEEGLVIKTDPVAGRSVEEGTTVKLYVSSDSTYEVEDYIGKNYSDVKEQLEALNLAVEVKEKDYLTKYEEFTIVEQEPNVGTILSSGDKVILYIPKVEVLYPDFVGEEWTLESIEDFCSKYEITLVKKYQNDNSYKSGSIIRQSRKAGTKVVSGSTLTITISEN